MKWVIIFGIAAMVSISCTTEKKSVALFNGKDLNGWHVDIPAMDEDPDLKSIPIVILTSSKAEEDIQKSYQLHCNCYLTKPVGLKEFESLINLINDFWLKVAKLPSKAI